jgi:negative regulator of sigma E activity
MKNEHDAWASLREHAASRISPGFPDRVLRAARMRPSPLFVAHFAMCAATAAICLAAVAIYQTGFSGDDNAKNQAGWSEIAAQANDLEQGQ